MSAWLMTSICAGFLSMLILNAMTRGIACFAALADEGDDE